MNIRIERGYDVHQLVGGCDLILSGVHTPFGKGLLGHSDADMLLYALTDTLLGAASLGSIDSHFPNTAAEFKDTDSRVLLRRAYQNMRALGWRVVNVDTIIITRKPRLAPHIPAIHTSTTADLGIRTVCVNIKGKTNEKLGYLGCMEVIEAQVAVLLQKADTL